MSDALSLEYLTGIGLPKWPAFVVVGDRNTRRQAAEMIVRCADLEFLSGNDRKFIAEIRAAVG